MRRQDAGRVLAQRRPRSVIVAPVSSDAAEDPARPPRDNDEWMRSLAVDGPPGDAARRDLRRVLVSGLRRILASRGIGLDVCEDFAQEALVRIRARLGAFRGGSRFTTWAMSIAIRIAFDELRHQRWKDAYEMATADARRPLTRSGSSGRRGGSVWTT